MARGQSHPYIPSAGILVQSFSQFRKMFPAHVDAETLKKLHIAPNNESVIISTLRFLGFLDEEGNKTTRANDIFLKHKDRDFEPALGEAVKEAYSKLFNELGDEPWSASRSTLISFFRISDETSELTAKRQAITFETLSSLSGHRETPSGKVSGVSKDKKLTKKDKSGKSQNNKGTDPGEGKLPPDIGLTVRVEINLPASGDQETYDRIFQSIRKNLLNA